MLITIPMTARPALESVWPVSVATARIISG